MREPISLLQSPKVSPLQKQTNRLLMTNEMQQGIHFLQLPLLELHQAIALAVEQNPLLEFIEEEEGKVEEKEPERSEEEVSFDEGQFDILKELDEDFKDLFDGSLEALPRRSLEDDKKRSFLENSIEDLPSLSSFLMCQAREVFSSDEDLKIAEILIGYLDEAGFLKTPLKEIADCFNKEEKQLLLVLNVLKTFEPVGIFSESTKEILLRQLQVNQKETSLAYLLLKDYYDDLLHSRLPAIQKKLKIPLKEIQKAIQNDIAHLDLHPGSGFSKREIPSIIPDVSLKIEGEKIVVLVKDEDICPIKLNPKYLKMLLDEDVSKESKEFIKEKLLSAKWLIRNVELRGTTLFRISSCLAEKQRDFFLEPTGKMMPLVMKQVAEELDLHESTIARAVAGKYFETPRGIFPMRYFFSGAFECNLGEDISSDTVKEAIRELIAKEDPKHPLSDQMIMKELSLKGIPCARRTVAKYRTKLEIGSQKQRRRY